MPWWGGRLQLHAYLESVSAKLKNVMILRYEDFMTDFDTNMRALEQLVGLEEVRSSIVCRFISAS